MARDRFFNEAVIEKDRVVAGDMNISLNELFDMLPAYDNLAARARKGDPSIRKFLRIKKLHSSILELHAAAIKYMNYDLAGLMEILKHDPKLLQNVSETTILEIAEAMSKGFDKPWRKMQRSDVFMARVACHAAIMAGEPNVAVAIAVLHAAETGSKWIISEMHALGHLPGRGVDVHIGSLLASNAEAKTLTETAMQILQNIGYRIH